jgi:hypothetical protein
MLKKIKTLQNFTSLKSLTFDRSFNQNIDSLQNLLSLHTIIFGSFKYV